MSININPVKIQQLRSNDGYTVAVAIVTVGSRRLPFRGIGPTSPRMPSAHTNKPISCQWMASWW